MTHKRLLIKLSGEQLAGEAKVGFDKEFIAWLAQEVKAVTEAGHQVVIVPGAGNWIRGADVAGDGIERATADYMGMLAGIINGQALMDIFQHQGLATRAMSSVFIEQICEPYIRRKAIRHLEKGRVVIITAGTGRPYYTHDTAGVSYGLELDCDIILKATNVDGIFDKDPNQDETATLFKRISFQQAIESADIKVMDKAALGLAMEQNMPIRVFNVTKPGQMLAIANGQKIGTLVSAELTDAQ